MNYKSLIYLAIITGEFACNHTPPPPPIPPVNVNTYTVKTGSAMYFSSYPATVTAVNEVEIRPQVTGYITGIFFKDGQRITKGEKLYQIDQQQYRGAYEQAVAQKNASEASLVKAQQDADRYTELGKQDAVAQQTVQHALADLETAKKQLDAAKANVSAVEVNLRYSTIYAPLSGTIGITQVKIGAAVSPGSTILNTISTDDPIAVDVALDETLIPFIEKQSLKDLKQRYDSTFTLTLADGSVYPGTGIIYTIDRAVDPQTNTIKIRLLFKNPNNFLRAGMAVSLRVANSTNTASILIPYRATVEQMAEYFVYVVNADTVSQRKVLLGPRVRDMAIVKSGLQPDEVIVLDGVQKLKDGTKVKTASSADSTNRSAADTTKRK